LGIWRDHILPRGVHSALGGEEHEAVRARVTAGLAGRVLEIGFGSGRNLRHLPAAVESVEAVEPSKGGRKLAGPAIAECGVPVRWAGEDAQAIDLPDGCIDAAVSTWTLCSVPDPRRGLDEMRRLLVPGGRLHFADHGLSPDAGVARWQRRLEPIQSFIFGGCSLLLPVDKTLAEAGFRVEQLDTFYMKGPRFSCFMYLGTAVAE
jgi:ubiquinone/menaquinone biosynthesis C-methylase UbiE